MRTGIAITTFVPHGAPAAVRERLVDTIRSLEVTTFPGVVFIVDDGSTDQQHLAYLESIECSSLNEMDVLSPVPTYRYHVHRKPLNTGVACAKNTSIRLLLEYGVDVGFLCDDDVEFHPGWWQAYLSAHSQTGIHHFSWLDREEHGSKEQTVNGVGVVESEAMNGILMTFTPEVCQRVGGMKQLPVKYGWEHCNWTERIVQSGLAPFKADILDSNTLITKGPKSDFSGVNEIQRYFHRENAFCIQNLDGFLPLEEGLPAQIPKIIHQLWIGPRQRPDRWMRTWPEKHPEWEYRLWTERELATFGFVNQRHIDAMPEWNGKADIMRYEILFRFGGVFADADTECIEPLDESFLLNDFWGCYENENARPGLIGATYMGASQGCRLMKRIIEELEHRTELAASPAWISVGPQLLTDTIARLAYPAKLFPSWYFMPEHFTGDVSSGPGKTYARHHWGSTLGLYEKSDSTDADRVSPKMDQKPGAQSTPSEFLLCTPTGAIHESTKAYVAENGQLSFNEYLESGLDVTNAQMQKICQSIHGWMEPDELDWIFEAARAVPIGGRWIEIGCWKGRSLLAAGFGLRDGCELWGIDDFRDSPVGAVGYECLQNIQKLRRARPGLRIGLFVADETTVSDIFPAASIDTVFIDGCHDYDVVKSQVVRWRSKITNCGHIAGHDYNRNDWPGVTVAVAESLSGVQSGPGSIWNWDHSESLQDALPSPSLSIVISTIGRPTLQRTLAGIRDQQLVSGDEVILVHDGPPNSEVERMWLESRLPGQLLNLNDGPHNDWGAAARTAGQRAANATHVLWQEDDGTYFPDAFTVIRRECAQSPDAFLLFRMVFPNGRLLWQSRDIVRGNLTTQLFVAPRVRTAGMWETQYCGDFDFIKSSIELFPDTPVRFVDRPIVMSSHPL